MWHSIVTMFIPTLSFILLVFEVQGEPPEERVVGGKSAALGQFPYMVSLRLGGSQGCGASILDKTHVLTAAHCVFGEKPNRFSIQYGVTDIRTNKNILKIKEITMHEDYKHEGNYPNDIAILTVDGEINIDNKNVKPTVLATSSPEIAGDSIDAVLCGWGLPFTGGPKMKDLQFTVMPLFNDELCTKYLGSDYDSQIHVCAGALDGKRKQCSADSGGPLHVDGVQHGIVSASFKPCTKANKPGLYAKVSTYREWIRTNSGV